MPIQILRSAALLFVLLLCSVAFAAAAHAQGNPMDGSGLTRRGHDALQEKPEKQVVPPPALPGAQAGSVAPAAKLPTDMSPNDALFDAINRGDIAAARDALSRGADLGARNLLGMTPMELSVDLSRNNISFLLLSYRGGDSARAAPPPAKTGGPAAKADTAKAAAKAPKAVAKATPVVAPAPPQTPRLFANDGGTPVPSVGFLGFDSGQAVR